MYNRPKPSETDEDLLKLQEEFFKQKAANKILPAAKLINAKNENTKNIEVETEDNETQNSRDDPIVGNIIEHKSIDVKPMNSTDFRFSGGFPKAKRRQETNRTSGSVFSNKKKARCNLPETHFEWNQSRLLTGHDKNDIHHENVALLDKMSTDEILEEQQKLMSNLNPDIINFIKSKSHANPNVELVQTETKQEVSVTEIESTQEILQNSEKWLNFQTVETEKMQWMTHPELPKELESGEPYEARFDFSGWLLPYAEPMSEGTRALYHHGEEPGRPGYALKELIKLCRSEVPQQRIFALNTLSNILTLSSTGVYDGVLDVPVEQIFFIVRVALDENSPAILNASLKAMHGIFCCRTDDVCADRLLGFGLGYVLPVLSNNADKHDDLNDQQLAETDLIKCLARTDILARFRYIIDTIMPAQESIIYCLEILARMLQDSHAIMTRVYNSGLFDSIFERFFPMYPSDKAPYVAAVRLMRVAACRSKHIARELVTKHNVIDRIRLYLSDNAKGAAQVKLQAECLHLFAVLSHYQLTAELFFTVNNSIVSALHYHLRTTDTNATYVLQNHFSGLANVISHTKDFRLIQNFHETIVDCGLKYVSQLHADVECGKLQIVSSLLVCHACFNQNNCGSVRFDGCIKSLLNSEAFTKLTQNIQSSSNLLCKFESQKCSANLNRLGAAVWGAAEHIVPCLQTNSVLPFITALSYFIEHSSDELKRLFLNHPNIKGYLSALSTARKLNLTSNWFTRVESKLLASVLKCNVECEIDFYELAAKTLFVFNCEQKQDVRFVLERIVFDKKFYRADVLLKSLSLEDSEDCLDNLRPMFECYSQILDLNGESFQFSSNLSTDIKSGNLLPVDWIFSPIVLLYSAREQKTDENKDLDTLINCLRWIILCETYFPEVFSYMNTTDKYCRLCCVFLCNNPLFLNDQVRRLLRKCLRTLLAKLDEINFDVEIQGLGSFHDLYLQLLEQYQAVSYGDGLFANAVLVPLAQRFGAKWRKAFWSEYAGVAQAVRFADAAELCLDLREYLEPAETDASLLRNYSGCLRRGLLERSPLLKQIVVHHLNVYNSKK